MGLDIWLGEGGGGEGSVVAVIIAGSPFYIARQLFQVPKEVSIPLFFSLMFRCLCSLFHCTLPPNLPSPACVPADCAVLRMMGAPVLVHSWVAQGLGSAWDRGGQQVDGFSLLACSS